MGQRQTPHLFDAGSFLWRKDMARLPEKNVLSGSKNPKTTTGEMKDALGKLRDYLNDLLGDDSADKEGARMALGIDLTGLTDKIAAKADGETIETAIQVKADKTELDSKVKELEEAIARRGTPVGSIEYFATAMPPAGYLKADGAAVGRETYPDLFGAIGTTFGQGDGETTFNLPDLIDRFAQGSNTPGQMIAAGLPNIEGEWQPFASWASAIGTRKTDCSGAFYPVGTSGGYPASGGNDSGNSSRAGFKASLSNELYGASDTVQPPALTLLPCIKAFDAATNPGLVDMTGLANEMAGKLDKTVNGNAVRYITDAFSDGTNWYRKWSDGWVEQGGKILGTGGVGGLNVVNLNRPSAVEIFLWALVATGIDQTASSGGYTQTNNASINFYKGWGSSGAPIKWYACGQEAQS